MSAPEMTWLPIESAPKDGTRILIAGDFLDEIEITEWCVMPQFDWEHVEGDLWRKIAKEPYCFWNGNGHLASHWMSLPPPPSASSGEG